MCEQDFSSTRVREMHFRDAKTSSKGETEEEEEEEDDQYCVQCKPVASQRRDAAEEDVFRCRQPP